MILYTLFKKLANNPFDVIVLNSNCGNKYDDKTYKLKATTLAGAYFVNQHYYTTLINNYKEGLNFLLRYSNRHEYRIDQFWQRLQKSHNWFVIVPSLCNQKKDYSDIDKCIKNFK